MPTLPPHILVPPPGPRSIEIASRLAAVECPAFEARREAREARASTPQSPIAYARAYGGNVEDADGNRYVDLVAGFGACILGHSPPPVREALAAQVDNMWLALGDVYGTEAKAELCEALAMLHPTPGARVMLGSSGADAVTSALKTCALATGKAGVVAFHGAYHGLSHGPLAACGLHPGFRDPFAGQLGEHVVFARYPLSDEDLAPSLAEVRDALGTGRIGAVLVEPVLGRGGCVVPPTGFLESLRRLAHGHGALLVADEIWTGLGRSGALVRSLLETDPDVICLGKGLGAGFPVSACIGTEAAMRAWGDHGGTAIHTATHFGNPLACAAALAVIRNLTGLPERARAAGEHLRDRVVARCGSNLEVRGVGLMIGIRHRRDPAWATRAARRLLASGYLVLTGDPTGATITLTPPLDIERQRLDDFVDVLSSIT